MSPQVYGYLGLLLLLLTGVRIVWRKGPKTNDWELLVAFIRLDFPPQQRDTAQKIATGLAEIVGLKIKQLRPEHTLKQIADWADEQIHPRDLITLFVVAFGVRCDANTTFRDLVEKITEKGKKSVKPGPEWGSRILQL
jgi:hypothetical protein